MSECVSIGTWMGDTWLFMLAGSLIGSLIWDRIIARMGWAKFGKGPAELARMITLLNEENVRLTFEVDGLREENKELLSLVERWSKKK